MGVIQRAIDGAIAAISPQKALERAEARQQLARTRVINTGYSHYGASSYKKGMAGWIYNGGSSREDIEDNLDVLRQRSRDLYMGVPLATGAIKTMRTNIVGRGLKLKPTIDREVLGIDADAAHALERRIEKEWELWADTPDCDAARIDNFCELQQLAFVSWLVSGDCLALLPVKKRTGQPYDLRVRLIEADRLSSPGGFDTMDDRIIGGVETDSTGEVIAYHFSKHHPLSLASQPMEWVRVPAYSPASGRRNVIHIMNRERIDQRRGVPFLAPVIEALKQLGRYTDAELVAAVVSGLFAVFVESENADGGMEGAIGTNVPDEDRVDDEDETTVELVPGAVIDLQPGEKAHAESPGRPNANFSGFVEAVTTFSRIPRQKTALRSTSRSKWNAGPAVRAAIFLPPREVFNNEFAAQKRQRAGTAAETAGDHAAERLEQRGTGAGRSEAADRRGLFRRHLCRG